MSGPTVTPPRQRICARLGCAATVKKPTGKYCSVRCCAIDPLRHERLREQARRSARTPVLPLSRQLAISFSEAPSNPEEMLGLLCQGREDAPAGLRRLTG